MQVTRDKFILVCFLVTLTFSAFFSFYKLGGTLMNVDQQHWTARSYNFIKAVEKPKFLETFQDPKPGVTVMWASGLSLELFLNLYQSKYDFKPQFYIYETFPLVDFALKAPLVLLNALFLILSSIIVAKLFDNKTGLVYLVLLSLHPFYLSINRFLHVDGSLNVFMNLTVLLFLLYIKYLNSKSAFKYLTLSGMCAGLALLTKTQALILPCFIAFCFAILVSIKKIKFTTALLNYLVWLLILIATFFVFFPAMWVAPVKVVSEIYREAFYVALTGNTRVHDILYYFLTLPRIFLWPYLISYVLAIVYLLQSYIKSPRPSTITALMLILILSFSMMYFLEMSFVKQKIERYLLPLFPTFVLFVAQFIVTVSNSRTFKQLVLVFIVILTAQLVFVMPHFETVNHTTFELNNYGSLFKEVGDYINLKPNAYNLNVVVMTKAYSLKPFVKGHTYGHEESGVKKIKVNYLVTNNYWLKTYGRPAYFSNCKKEQTIYFRKDPYWDIYKCF